MASKCRTALVDPPRAITIVIAFSKAFLVIISEGLISFSNKFIIASPALKQSSSLSCEIAS